MVYVIDKEGRPMMPTERHGKVRRLLRDKKAHVILLIPFTIQLDYDTSFYTQEVSLGIDAGSVHIGVSGTTEKKELFAGEFILRKDIVNNISSRNSFRKTRRYRKTRYRAPRFNNRKKKDNWIAPSIKNKIDMHLKAINFVHKILPITKITIEVALFDILKIKNKKIQGIEYQKGEQMSFWNVREYVFARDKHMCQHCHGKSGDKVLNVHHLESRKTGGNAPNNLITLCETCHNAYHKGEFELKLKRGKSLRDAAAMNVMRWKVYEQAKKQFKRVYLTYGYFTKYTRIKNKIEKTHYSDAFCISGNIYALRLNKYYICKCLQRHTRILHVCNPKRHGIRRSTIASHWIGKTKLLRYDTVMFKRTKCFIYGSTNGRPILKDIYGKSITETLSINPKTIKYISRKRNNLIISFIK